VSSPGLAAGTAPRAGGARPLVAHRRAFGEVPAQKWDDLVVQTAAATPFARNCVQRAWWDAYGATAHDETLVVLDETDPEDERIIGIAPLMHRHEVEPGDLAAHTALRCETAPHLAAVPATATAIFFGASYHADYATVLAAPADVAAVCQAVAVSLAERPAGDWDVVDLRRLRHDDPATDALAGAFEPLAARSGWQMTRETEDVCPVLALAPGADFEAYLGSLDKKERHEIRRKIRRAEAAGPIALESSAQPGADLDAFVDLHQKRWGAQGLFPPTEGGAASRRFFAGLFEACPPAGILDLSFLTVAGKRIAAGVTFDDGASLYYYNAGVEPDARDLSPGVLMVACYIRRAIELGRTRLDFLRGNEPYKYAWGALDEPVERLLIRRVAADSRAAASPEAR
jgi:CelD/BcsL family acetyltransferase involved in cellulose biosynthesis